MLMGLLRDLSTCKDIQNMLRIYKEEEEERSDHWKSFLECQTESAQLAVNGLSLEEDDKVLQTEASQKEVGISTEKGADGHDLSGWKPDSDKMAENGSTKVHRVRLWTEIRPSLHAIEDMMSIRVKKSGSLKDDQNKSRSQEDEQSNRGGSIKYEQNTRKRNHFLIFMRLNLLKEYMMKTLRKSFMMQRDQILFKTCLLPIA
ncbi:TBC1 domain family member protein [Quillaja saponaria]|uniref:TBC1 domain family member protein n=1 Tax=Quillaja saponaria TaxID=32244 RepID=A0AAD7Q7F9_QUISA|nr:TBC1 domain family member protein [Quillaja saponaria]